MYMSISSIDFPLCCTDTDTPVAETWAPPAAVVVAVSLMSRPGTRRRLQSEQTLKKLAVSPKSPEFRRWGLEEAAVEPNNC
ncbi:hypothetical protein ACJIZ3_019263 [Penstemon smallii]|uniref:Uncharacterized protein n=1 Tax=Penstemon smallii TaxID=265156 RepID=A0ABD3T1D7_9LAMI